MTPLERLRKRVEIVRDKLDEESSGDQADYRDSQAKVEILEWVLQEIERIGAGQGKAQDGQKSKAKRSRNPSS